MAAIRRSLAERALLPPKSDFVSDRLEPVPQPRRRSEAVERFRGNIGLRAGKALAA
jgi:hypothetical protein